MQSAESVPPPQGGDFANDDEDALSQANSSRSLNSWDSFRSESSYIGGPDIEERRDNFWYRKVFANSSREDAPKTKNIPSSGIPKHQKFLSQFRRVIRKSAPNPVDGQTDKNSLPKAPISHPPLSDETEVSLPAIYGGESPRFSEAPISEGKKLFLEKLRLCCALFELGATTGRLKAKRKNLQELVEYVNIVDTEFDEEEIEQIVNMVSVNLFRPLPPHTKQLRRQEAEAYQENQVKLAEMDLVDRGDQSDQSPLDPAWSHIKLVYQFLLRVVASITGTQAPRARRYFDSSFLSRFANLFDSQDPREREWVMKVFHRLYDKFMVHRPYLRWTMRVIFIEFMNESEKHSGIAQLLEVLRSIISGFALPLKDEHKLTLFRVLIPLHKAKTLAMYSSELASCVTLFVEKDPTLVPGVISGLLKNWPRADWSKEVLLLGELEQVLQSTRTGYIDLKVCMRLAFRQIARCIQSPHLKVAERALWIWGNNHVLNLIAKFQTVILPIVYPALENNAHNHWNPGVEDLSVKVKKILFNIDNDPLPLTRRSLRNHAVFLPLDVL